MPDDPSATLAGIRENFAARSKRAQGLGADPADFRLLLAALEAVLKLADDWMNTPWPEDGGDRAGVATEQIIQDGAALHAAITAELAGTGSDHA